MYIELATSDPDLVARLLQEQIADGKAVRVTLSKSGNLHRLSLSHLPEEAVEAVEIS